MGREERGRSETKEEGFGGGTRATFNKDRKEMGSAVGRGIEMGEEGRKKKGKGRGERKGYRVRRRSTTAVPHFGCFLVKREN